MKIIKKSWVENLFVFCMAYTPLIVLVFIVSALVAFIVAGLTGHFIIIEIVASIFGVLFVIAFSILFGIIVNTLWKDGKEKFKSYKETGEW